MSHEIGWPVSLVKQLTTVSEFDKWQIYFRMRRETHDKSDWQTASVVRAIFSAMSGDAPDLSKCLLQYTKSNKPKPEKPIESQDVWLGMMGIDRDDPSTWGTQQ